MNNPDECDLDNKNIPTNFIAQLDNFTKGLCKPVSKNNPSNFDKNLILTPQELLYNVGDSVVKISSEFILLGQESGYTGQTNLPIKELKSNARFDVVLDGTGFFIKNHYIVCPAQLVLMPPSLTSVCVKYPYHTGEIPKQMTDTMIRATRILVTVFNVNRSNNSFVYEASLVGVDGAGDIALLKISHFSTWNFINPKLTSCHPYLKWGSSRGSKDGDKIYLLSSVSKTTISPYIIEGILSDHRHLDKSGKVLAECMLASVTSHSKSVGLPIIDCQGDIIGMQTTYLPTTSDFSDFSYLALGPSEFFMKPVIKEIIKADTHFALSPHIEKISDIFGDFFRYKKGYIGLGYNVFSGIDYDYNIDYTSGPAPKGMPCIRTDESGNLLNVPILGVYPKEEKGIRVLGLAGINPSGESDVVDGYYYIPGGVNNLNVLPHNLPVSPLLNKIKPGYQITKISDTEVCYDLGVLGSQIAPSLFTWRLSEGDMITLTFRPGGNSNKSDPQEATDYDNLDSVILRLLDFPKFMDYPWYAISNFPLLSKSPYPLFTFDQLQSKSTQLPQLQGEGKSIFQPAI